MTVHLDFYIHTYIHIATCILLFQETKEERKRSYSPSASKISNPVEKAKKLKTDKGVNCVVEIAYFLV